MNDDFAEVSVTPEPEGRTGDDASPPVSGEPAAIPAKETARREGRFDQVTGTALNVTRTSWVFLRVAGRVLRRVFKKDSMPNLVLVLFLLTVIIAAGLGAVYTVTAPVIEEVRELAFAASMGEVFPGQDLIFTRSSIGDNIYEGRDGGGDLAGFAVQVSQNGYGGTIDMVVGINVMREITGIIIVSHRETRGFDTKGRMPESFIGQFIGQSGSFEIGAAVDAVSGATVSSKAVAQGVNNALDMLEGRNRE